MAKNSLWAMLEQLVGNAKHKCVHFYFGGLRCGMEGFVHRKAIPDIKSLIEEVFWDVGKGENPPRPRSLQRHTR